MSTPMGNDYSRPPPPVLIDWIGPVASRLLRECTARPALDVPVGPPRLSFVAAVFDRGLLIEHAGSFICIGLQGVGRGPLNATAGPADRGDWLGLVSDGEPVRVTSSGISAAAWRVDASQARAWRPRPWPEPAAPEQLKRALTAVRERAARSIPTDGLAPLVLANAGRATPSALDRLAEPRLADLERWLAAPAVRPPPLDLLGLGPGLTPSGDDCLCGVLLALDALQARSPRATLATAVAAAAPHLTTPLSAGFLAAAAEGYGSEALHRFIASLVGADMAAIPETIAALVRIGHTSGWDALAGAVLAVRANAEARPPRKSP